MAGKADSIKKQVSPILKKYGVKKAALFGSFARGTAKKNSDVDILVEFDDTEGLFYFISLKRSLERKLHRKVDLVEYGAIHPYLKKSILSQQVHIL